MYKKHLLGGVAKGAFDEAAADAKFEKWMNEKAAKISAKTQKLTGEKEKSEKARLAAEKEANEKKAKAIEAKRAEAAAAAAAQTEEAEAPAEGEDDEYAGNRRQGIQTVRPRRRTNNQPVRHFSGRIQ